MRASLIVALLLASTPVAAQTEAPSPTEARLGLDLIGMPWGAIKVLVSESGGGDTPAPALGIMPVADLQHGAFLIGVSPRLILGVRDDDAPWAAAGTIWNVLFRLGASTNRGESVDVYGYVTPGLAWLVRPGYETSRSVVLGAHLGLRGRLGPRMFWAAEVGGDKAYTAVAYSYLQMGFGLGWRFELPDRRAP